MARGNLVRRYRRFARGVNTADNAYNLRDGYEDDPTGLGAEARDALNALAKDRGSLAKRDGCTTLKARAGVKDLSVVDEDAAGLLIYSTTAGGLFALDEIGTETTLVASGLSATAPWNFVHVPAIGGQGPYYGMNGVDTPRQVTTGLTVGNWTAASGTLPNGKAMVYAGNRLWVITDDALYWSEIGDPRTWPVENITRFNPSDGEPLTGLAVLGNYVLVFKERDIWVVYDLDTSANRRLADAAGTLSPRSIVSTELGCFFLDPQRGVMLTDGSSVKEVSRQILPTLRRISATDAADVEGAFWHGRYFLAARLDGATRRLFDFHQESGAWWFHSHPARAVATWDRGQGEQLVAAHPNTLARLFVPGEGKDEGVNFSSYWSGPFHDFGSPHLNKRCREIQVDGGGVIDVRVAPEFFGGAGDFEGTLRFIAEGDTFGGSGTFGGTGTFGGSPAISTDSLRNLGVGRVWSVTFGNNSADPWEIDSYVMMMDQRKD